MEHTGRTRTQRVGLALGPLVAAAVYLLPSGLHALAGLGDRPAAAAAVAAWMAVWWFTEALPMALTSLLPLALFPLLGVFGGGPLQGVARSAAPFVDPYIFLFMGGMAVGAALEACGLLRRLALHILGAIGTSPRRLLLGVLVATASVSLWISNTATAVMMLPIAMALLAQLEASEGRRLRGFGCALMLAVAYGANLGGMGTKLGTPGNSVFAGYAARRLGYDVGFLEFLAIGLPAVLLLLPLAWGLLWRVGRTDAPGGGQGAQVVAEQLRALGPLSRAERTVGVLFAAAALLWMLGDPLRALLAPHVAALTGGFALQAKHYEAAVAMLAAFTALALGRLSLAALRRVPWDTLLLLGGGFALAAGIEGSGLSTWLSGHLGGLASLGLGPQLLAASSSTILLSALASNTATVNVMLNVVPGSLPVLAVTTLASSCDFALPAGTPPNAIVFGSGYVHLPTMMRVGLLLDVLAALVLALYGLVWVRYVLG